jgi:hypothetical protein
MCVQQFNTSVHLESSCALVAQGFLSLGYHNLIEDAELPVAWRDPALHAPLGISIVLFSLRKRKIVS